MTVYVFGGSDVLSNPVSPRGSITYYSHIIISVKIVKSQEYPSASEHDKLSALSRTDAVSLFSVV